ncbi:MAG: sugar phosphate isomerase/epimerase [Phycisphaeraceae bacterium]|nr:sugar phosphate isomerase/epimerase [Phycisphaeraceae bacterium]
MQKSNMPLGVTAVMLPELDLAEQLTLCQRVGVAGISLRPRHIMPENVGKPYANWGNYKFDLTPERLVKEGKQIRRQMDDAGIKVFGTVPAVSLSDTDDKLKLNFEGGQIVGAGAVRVAPENWRGYPQGPFNYREILDKTVAGYQRAVALAKPYQQKVVIETHAGMIAASPSLAWNICRHFDPRELGVIFDIANFNIEGGYQPNLAVAVMGDYIDHCHVGGTRRSAGNYDAQGFRKFGLNGCPLTEADLYIPDWIKSLHEAGRHVPLVIEDFTENMSGALRLENAAAALHRVLAAI